MDFSKLMGLATGHVEARIIQSAVELAIFDALDTETQNASELARGLELNAPALELLLNALAALGLLSKRDNRFEPTEVARRYLCRSSAEFAGGMIAFESMSWRVWEKLPEAIRGGQPARPANMYQADPAETEIFINAMDSLVKARGDTEALAAALDWSAVTSLLDVGSGPATYPIALCRKFPQLRATIVDLPGTLAITARRVNEAGLSERIDWIAADYRCDPVPGVYDAIFLSNIIHGENFDRNAALMNKLAACLKPGGRLIVKDHILNHDRATPAVGAIFSLLMLLTTDGGRCYSFAEIASWLTGAGLAAVEQIDLPAPMTSSLVIASKI